MDAETGTQSGAESGTTQSGGTGGSGEGNTSTGSMGSNTGTQGGNGSGTGNQEETVSRTDFDAVTRRMQAADKRAAEFEQKLRELTQKDLPEAEKLKAEHEAATQKLSQLSETNRKLVLENAFLKDNTHKWKNPGTAMKLVDLSGVTIDDEGHVVGLKDALKKLANSEPYLLEDKPANEGSGSSGGAAGTGTPPAAGGVPPMNGKPDSAAGANKGMETRLPALMSRRRPRPS